MVERTEYYQSFVSPWYVHKEQYASLISSIGCLGRVSLPLEQKMLSPQWLEDKGQSLLRDIEEQMQQMCKGVATERNFSVAIDMTEAGVYDLQLKRPDGKVFSCQSLLPVNMQFWKAESFSFYTPRQLVTFNEERMQEGGSILALTHEIGHAHRFIPPGFPSVDELRGANTQEKQRLFFFLAAAEEKGAWQSSIMLMAHLQREGYNVFSEFDSKESLEEYITLNLLTYETKWREWQYKQGGEAALTTASPLFVTVTS